MHYLILDGYNLIHRARGGFQKGEWPIVFNFFRGLRPLVEKFAPDFVWFVLEGRPVRQESLLGEYKANRSAPDESFGRQKDKIIEILSMMPIDMIWHPAFEADDVIHNLLTRLDLHIDHCTFEEHHATVVSSDSDFTQLLQRERRTPRISDSRHIKVWNWRTDEHLTAPEYDYVAWKSLRGDPTDNIPKCPGMNDGRAATLLLSGSDPIGDASVSDRYRINRQLIEFVDMTADEWDACSRIRRCVEPDWSSVRAAFEACQFKSMTKEPTWSKWVRTFEGLR